MSWDPYLDLQTGVLRNRLGITDRAELAQAGAELISYRLIELQLNPLPGRYDLAPPVHEIEPRANDGKSSRLR